jgi:mannose-6-phosphate isomerase-like protein (cupin superfamily)
MRARQIIAAVVSAAALGTVYFTNVVAQTNGNAPTDQAVPFPKSTLDRYVKDTTLVDGGRYNVSIRRINKPDARPSTQPMTINVWYVREGSGAVTTGGTFADGKATGGVTDQLHPGDVIFIPANLPYFLSDVGPQGITLLNTRWDVDWNGRMGAGNPPVPSAAGGAFAVGEYAADKAVFLPKGKLDAYIAEQNSRQTTSQTMRMVEGGHFNVNIRNITEPSIEFHENTIDTWVVLQGAGTAATGFSTDKGDMHTEATGRDAKRIENTGVETPMAVGDVMFVPSNFTHGFSQVDGRVVWLNIRWDSNY